MGPCQKELFPERTDLIDGGILPREGATVGHRELRRASDPSIAINCPPRSSLAMQAILLGEAACLLYTGFGCARMPKKLLSEAPTVPRSQSESRPSPSDGI